MLTMHNSRVEYFNMLVRDMTRETVKHEKALTQEDRNKVVRQCEEALSGTPMLFREFMAARTEGKIVFPKKSGVHE